MNRLYFGDNLDVLRSGEIKDESVDLIYLDPPFNSSGAFKKIPVESRASIQPDLFRDTTPSGRLKVQPIVPRATVRKPPINTSKTSGVQKERKRRAIS